MNSFNTPFRPHVSQFVGKRGKCLYLSPITTPHTTHTTQNTHMFVSNAALIKTATMKRDIRGNSLASGVSETMAKNCLNCTICFFYYYHTAPYHTATHTHIYVVNVLSSVRRKCNAVQCSADRTTWSICSARN